MAKTIHRIHLFGLDFISAASHHEFLGELVNYPNIPAYQNLSKLPLVITPNADQIVQLDEPQFRTLKEQLSQCLFILPDGQPIVWFSRLIGKPLQARLTGSDLFPLVWQTAKQHQQKVFIIVSHEELGIKLKQDYDNIIYYTPEFFNPLKDNGLFEKVCTEIIEKISEFKPHYVIVGIGFPKQELLSLAVHASLVKQQLNSPLFLLLGASAEFYVGTKKRAPVFLQKMGLEWLHRLSQEPRRLWKRYILGAWRLLHIFIKNYSKE
ncbi:MAG: hypothetical protein BWK79_15600 [Beggiatoa sp. IS2]|nr:MAG: hypothetical protein BWK79_15600 [Beggiatoa sp. IS2]